jgi:signal peptidase I
MDSFWTERSTQVVLALIGVLVAMRVVLRLVSAQSLVGRFILFFWHDDARHLDRPMEKGHKDLTLQTMDSTLLALAVVFLIVRPFVLQAFYIPSASMEPTLYGRADGRKDRVLVNKYVYWLRPPRRGDIVVFKAPPAATHGGHDEDFIKRLIGLPGDTIEVRRHHAFINGQPLDEPYIAFKISTGMMADYGPEKVPAGHYFMMGDHRDASFDSRGWGFLPQENVLGKAMCVFWPAIWPPPPPFNNHVQPDEGVGPRHITLRLLK